MSLCRAEWKKEAIEPNLPNARCKAAYRWVLENNPTYARYLSRHKDILASEAKNRFYITTANLLLHEHGIEVAMRPYLYPREAFGDSDVAERLLRLGRMTDKQKSSVRTSFLKKCLSRCRRYAGDYMLCFLMYDIAMARALLTTVQFAKKNNLTPDRVCDSYCFSETYWRHEVDIVQDLIRIMDRRSRDPSDEKLFNLAARDKALIYPNVFITVTANEWDFPFHSSISARFKGKQMTDFQGPMTLDIYRVLMETMQEVLVSNEFF